VGEGGSVEGCSALLRSGIIMHLDVLKIRSKGVFHLRAYIRF
jgi:hypothetical protein